MGWRNWAVFYYNSFIENIFIALYLLAARSNFSNTGVADIFLFLGLSIFSTTVGYLVNDLSDRELDKKHGKSNTFQDDSTGKAVFVISIMLFIAVLFGIRFFYKPIFLGAWLLWLFLAVFYSMPPLRFKEKGPLGLILVVLAQRGLPAILILLAFDSDYYQIWLLWFFYVLFRGLSSDISHQLLDSESDKKTDTKTAAVTLGRQKLSEIFRWILRIEKILLLFLLIIIVYVNHTQLLLFVITSIPLLIYLPMLLVSIIQDIKSRSSVVLDPHGAEKNIQQFIHFVFPNLFLSFYCAALMSVRNPAFIIIIIYLVFNYRLYKIQVWKDSFLRHLFLKITNRFSKNL